MCAAMLSFLEAVGFVHQQQNAMPAWQNSGLLEFIIRVEKGSVRCAAMDVVFVLTFI